MNRNLLELSDSMFSEREMADNAICFCVSVRNYSLTAKRKSLLMPKRNTKGHRRKFTTMLCPVLRNELKKKAIDESMSVADILEELVSAYLDGNEKSPSK